MPLLPYKECECLPGHLSGEEEPTAIKQPLEPLQSGLLLSRFLTELLLLWLTREREREEGGREGERGEGEKEGEGWREGEREKCYLYT